MIFAPPPQIEKEPGEGRPVASAAQWLGRNASSRRKLWERLNPIHRRQLRVLARALALAQSRTSLPESTRAKLLEILEELRRVTRRAEQLLAGLTNRTPPPR
ncbi:MAG: hypothetical protein ACRD50_00420 [Candidatus Acidiferrales bacterium]